MPTGQPSNTDAADPTEAQGRDARDGDDVASVLSDDRLDDAPGGGGPLDGHAQGRAGAATPNSPIDAGALDGGGERLAEREARTRALGDAPAGG